MEPSKIEQRYHFIELIAWWEGGINTTYLAEQFGLSRQQCSADLNSYIQQFAGNLVYNSSLKAYQATESFSYVYISGDVSEYLYWIHSGHTIPHASKKLALANIALTLPARQVSAHIMRGLIAAIRQQRRVEVDYVSLNNPDHQGRIIAPHSFINTGLRWHLRAWCEKSQEFRDFVLSRFRGRPDLLDKSGHTQDQDKAWNTQVIIKLQPDPRLSPAKREVLENDYQMQNGQLHIATKGCLVNYLLREMQINTKMLDGNPDAQQLVLVNPHDIKPWLFEG